MRVSASKPRHLPLIAAVFGGLYLAFLFLFEQLIVARTVPTDFAPHLEFMASIWERRAYLPHPLFHVLTQLVSRSGALPPEWAATLVMASVFTSTAALQFWIVRRALGEGPEATGRAVVAALFLTFACAIYVPMVNPTIYLGQLSPNAYHNPTYPLMKLFALLAFDQATQILDGERQRWRLALCVLATLASALAKPNFVPIFVAGFGVAVIARCRPWGRHEVDRRLVGFLAVLASVTACVLGWQYLVTFTPRSAGGLAIDPSGNNRIIVDEFLRHWRTRTPSVSYSIAVALAFPASVLLFRARSILASPSGGLPWAILGFGMASYACLIDLTAPGVSNFGWSYMIGQAVVFLAATVEFLRWSAEDRRGAAYPFVTLLAGLHALSGAYYFSRVASGGSVW